jgi:hypothetical protein
MYRAVSHLSKCDLLCAALSSRHSGSHTAMLYTASTATAASMLAYLHGGNSKALSVHGGIHKALFVHGVCLGLYSETQNTKTYEGTCKACH